jgi:tRNA(fMet)-specific endonuclease VapC
LKGYLLDTNHVAAWKNKHPQFMAKLASIGAKDLPRVCAITLGEIEAGHQITSTTDQPARDEFTTFVITQLHPYALNVTLTTRTYYGQLMGRIWANNRPGRRTKTEGHLRSLGVDINDVWIAAVAWEHNLTLLTSDSMAAITAVLPEVQFEDWLI